MTQINFKKVIIKVPRYEIKKGGWFIGDYSTFFVETEIQDKKEKLRVSRKDADFYTLRRNLKL